MKILSFVFLLVAACNTETMAQSMLKVALADNSLINVSVDGRYFNKKGTTVTVGELPPGRHRLEIYSVEQTRNGRGHEEVVYAGKIITHDGNITLFTYDPYTQQKDVQEQDMNSYVQNNPQSNIPPQQHNNGFGYDSRNERPAPHVNRQAATLTDAAIDQLKTRVNDKPADIDKLKLMKDGLGGETMTADEVGIMMDFFTFEDTKVEFAKWAYANTIDKENFASLESKLSYQNYVDDLDKFIKDNKQK